jgi:hypothetical protein
VAFAITVVTVALRSFPAADAVTFEVDFDRVDVGDVVTRDEEGVRCTFLWRDDVDCFLAVADAGACRCLDFDVAGVRLTAGFDFLGESFILFVDFFAVDFTVAACDFTDAACGAKSTTVGFAIGPLLKDELQSDETTAENAADTSKQRDDHNAAASLRRDTMMRLNSAARSIFLSPPKQTTEIRSTSISGGPVRQRRLH